MLFEKDRVANKLRSINFRGPNNLGICDINGVILGHLRLSIIDLDERANQPMSYQKVYGVYNGEIYNFESLKKELGILGYQFTTSSDTEVLLAGYIEWGYSVVDKLNGMFSFCIYDTQRMQLFCARDRLGVKPFYYYWKDGNFEICSQLRPISQQREIEPKAISLFLDCGYIPSPYSIFKDVYKLPPGNTLTIDLLAGEKHISEYWNLQKIEESMLSYHEAKIRLHELLADAVKIRLVSDVPIGVFLSGGIDSALVAAIAAKNSSSLINTFSIGFDDQKFDESKIAREYAVIINSCHKELICRPKDVIGLIPKLVLAYDEPFADSSALPSLLLNSAAKQYITVALSGDGGDESFFGYNHFESVEKFNKLNAVPFYVRSLLSILLNKIPSSSPKIERVKHILRLKSVDAFIEAIFIGYDSLQKTRYTQWLKHYRLYKVLSTNNLQKAADLNIKLWLENDSNVKVDRASMAYSMEVRSPFLDYRIIEFARSLPVSYRYQKGKRKRILRDILKEYIPEEVFDRPKKGFSVPIGNWMRNELRDEFISNLSDDFLQLLPNLNVIKFKKMLAMHMKGERNYAHFIWRMYVLSKWYQEFGFHKKTQYEIKAINV